MGGEIRDEVAAEVKPEHGPDRDPPSPVPLTDIYSHFLPQKTLHFITIKCNKQKKFQTIDSVRKLISRYYCSYVIVRSPKTGIHWHILAAPSCKRSLKVPKGTHLKVQVLGRLNVSTSNRRPREDPMLADASLYSQLRYVRQQAKPSVVSKSLARSTELAQVITYLLQNLLENETKSTFGHLAIRFI